LSFKTIYADYPWPYEVWNKDTGHGRSAEAHYRTMTWEDIGETMRLTAELSEPGTATVLWVVPPSMDQAMDLMREGGWSYVTKLFCWVKLNRLSPGVFTGMGHYTRANTEDALLYVKDHPKHTPKRKSKGISQVGVTWDLQETETHLLQVTRHSEKPAVFSERIEALFHGPYLEMFARRLRPGWVSIGLELDGLDIRESFPVAVTGAALPTLAPVEDDDLVRQDLLLPH